MNLSISPVYFEVAEACWLERPIADVLPSASVLTICRMLVLPVLSTDSTTKFLKNSWWKAACLGGTELLMGKVLPAVTELEASELPGIP